MSGLKRWTTKVQWSNTGGIKTSDWVDCVYMPGGTVKIDMTQQRRWSCGLTVRGVDLGRDGLNPFTTRIRILHGEYGKPLQQMGAYKITNAKWASDDKDAISVTGSSYEIYLQRARFITPRTFAAGYGSTVIEKLIKEVLPATTVTWDPRIDKSLRTGRIDEPTDRWGLIFGQDRGESPSIGRAMGAQVYTGATGQFIVDPVPTIQDAIMWEASEGPGGVLLSHEEELSDEDVFNVYVVKGVSDDGKTPLFAPGVASDDDPLSLTYVGRSPEQGGFGPCIRYYSSPFIKSTEQARRVAMAKLAPYLGLKQKVDFAQLHDPKIKPGMVGLVHTKKGPRRVIPDAITYSLDGGPMSFETRTTTTMLGTGSGVDLVIGEAGEDAEDGES